jgi:hypothetical protein
VTEAEKNIKAPIVTVENVPLEQFESLVYSRQHEEAGRELLRILKRLKVGGEFAGHPVSDETRPRLYTRLASAITALMADPQFQLSQEGFDLLAVEHATFNAVFVASAFGNSDHLLRQFGVPDADEPNRLHFSSPQNIVKLLLAYSLESELELDFEEIFRAAPRLALPAFLGMLAHIIVLSPAAHRRREKLLTLGPLFEQVELGEHMLAAVSDAYMYCSYATAEGKHDIKRSFNKMMRRLIEKQIEIPALPAGRKIRKRPTILVPIEWFTSLHAMYRCYAPSIRQLRDKFRLVMIGRSSEMDAVSKQLFDDVIEIDAGNVSLADIVGHIRRVAPDIIYYPSLGMATWWVALSTVRLAPIQIATMGHPASPKSEAIDYVIADPMCPGDPSCFDEIVVIRERSFPFVMRQDASIPAASPREHPQMLRVAVPSMACKLNAPFLATLQRIAMACGRPLEFHFFPNMVGMTWYQITKEIRRWLPGAVVHPRSDYNQYLQWMTACDLHLSTFPFGGTNSNIDSMHLGIPMVALEGLEIHAQTDAGMIRMAGLPESLVSYHPQEYERIALRVIESDAERLGLARQLLDSDIDARFMSASMENGNEDFLDIFSLLYAQHEKILSCGERWLTPDRWRALAAETGKAR